MKKFILLFLLAVNLSQAATIASFPMTEHYGVSHPEEIFCADVANFDTRTSKLIGPNGVTEVPYQKTYGQICFPARLPASTVPTYISVSPSVNATNDTISWVFPWYGPAVNQLVYFEAADNGCGLTSGTTYFVARYSYYFHPVNGIMDTGGSFKSTLGGSIINLSSGCAAPKLTYTGFTAVGSTDTFTAPNHQRQAGDKIQFYGTRPTGIAEGTAYYVIASGHTADAFKVSATAGGSAVDIGDLASGLNRLVTNWTWTLVDTGAPTATATNPVVIDQSAAGYVQLTNGLTGARALKFTNPQTFSVGGGTLTDCVIATVMGSRNITCTFPGDVDTIMPPASKVTINGSSTSSEDVTGVWTVTSNPTVKKIYIVTGDAFLNDTTYNNSTLTVVAGDTSWNPVQGIMLSGGTWDATGTKLYGGGGVGGASVQIGPNTALAWLASFNRSYSYYFKEAGPLKTTIVATWTGYRPVYYYPNNQALAGMTAGTGQYQVEITLLANSKSVGIEVLNSDFNYAMALEMYSAWPGTKPTTWANRTASAPGCGTYGPITITDATNTSPIVLTTATPHGFAQDGIFTYTGTAVTGNTAANTTALVTPITAYTFSIPVAGNGAYTGGGTLTATSNNFQSFMTTMKRAINYGQNTIVGDACSSSVNVKLAAWNPVGIGGAEQWFYNIAGSAGDPAVGVFTGQASQQFNGNNSMVGVYSSDALFGGTALGIYAVNYPCINCTESDRAFTNLNHRKFYVYAGGTIADITPTGSLQTPSLMTQERNKLAGAGNLTEIYKYVLDFPDPGGGWTFPFMPDADVDTIRDNYQTNNPAGYTALMNASLLGSSTLLTWTADNSASIDTYVTTPLIGFNQSLAYSLVYGDGVQDPCCEYVQVTYVTGPATTAIANALPNPHATVAQQTTLKAYAAGFCSLLWNENFIPTFVAGLSETYESIGTTNQDQQVEAAKARCVSAFPTQPYLALQGASVNASLVSNIVTGVHPSGACSAPPHYCAAANASTMFGILSQKKAGSFNSSSFPTLARFNRWITSLLTPPEVRFGGVARMEPGIGDGETAVSGMVGMLAEIYRGVDTGISEQSIAAFFAQQSATTLPYFDFFGDTLTAINTTVTNPGLTTQTTANFTGSHTTLRHNWGTANEHQIVVMNGTFSRDHGHYDWGGLAPGYLFKTPWFWDSEAIYSPYVPSAYFHSTVVADSDLGFAWDAQPTSNVLPQDYGTPAQTETLAFTKSSRAVQVMTKGAETWTRATTLINANAAKPVFWDKSTFSDAVARTNSYFVYGNTQGVLLPGGGSNTPTIKQSTCVQDPSQFPSSFTPVAISTGVQGPWRFTGMLHPALAGNGNGIDVDAYYVRGHSGDQFGLSEWQHACGVATAETAYKTANTIAPTSFTQTSSTTAEIVAPFYFAIGQTATIDGVTGAGTVDVAAAVVTAVSGTTTTFSGFSGLTGSYTVGGAIVAPDYIQAAVIWRQHGTGAFDTTFLPNPKSGSPQAAPTAISSGYQVVNGGETTTYGDDFITFTDGTVKVAAALNTTTVAAHNITLTGGAQEVAMSTASAGVWTVTGFTPGTRCANTSAFGTLYPSGPHTTTGTGIFCLFGPGPDGTTGQPPVQTLNLSTTPVTFKTPYLGWKDTVAASYAVSVGGVSVAQFTCTANICGGSLKLAAGSYTITYQPLDGAGARIGNVGSQSLTVN